MGAGALTAFFKQGQGVMRTEVKVGLFIALFAGVVIAIIQLAKPSNEVVTLDKDKTTYVEGSVRKAGDSKTTSGGSNRTTPGSAGAGTRTGSPSVATPANSTTSTLSGATPRGDGATAPPARRPDVGPIATPLGSSTTGTSTTPGGSSTPVGADSAITAVSKTESAATPTPTTRTAGGSSLGSATPVTPTSPAAGTASPLSGGSATTTGATNSPPSRTGPAVSTPLGTGSTLSGGSTLASGNTTAPERKVTSPSGTTTGSTLTPPAKPTSGSLTALSGSTYSIKDGDTLTSIARRELGDGNLWTAIKDANPGLDERRLAVGKTINLPSRDSLRVATDSSAAKTSANNVLTGQTGGLTSVSSSGDLYTVTDGDSLAKIARTQLGSAERWQEIYELNKDMLANPNAITIGMTLKLPTKSKS